MENTLQKIMIFLQTAQIELADLPVEIAQQAAMSVNSTAPDNLSIKQAVASLEQQYISTALKRTGGNRVQAAKLLEISLRALHYKIKEYGL
jgi:two-component system response regulator AtoC